MSIKEEYYKNKIKELEQKRQLMITGGYIKSGSKPIIKVQKVAIGSPSERAIRLEIASTRKEYAGYIKGKMGYREGLGGSTKGKPLVRD